MTHCQLIISLGKKALFFEYHILTNRMIFYFCRACILKIVKCLHDGSFFSHGFMEWMGLTLISNGS